MVKSKSGHCPLHQCASTPGLVILRLSDRLHLARVVPDGMSRMQHVCWQTVVRVLFVVQRGWLRDTLLDHLVSSSATAWREAVGSVES